MPHREPPAGDETRTYEASGDAAESTPIELRRGSIIGRFVILDELGAGGMGRVFQAFDPELDRKVAVKVLHPGRSAKSRRSDDRRRILREAQALARLRHQNVLTIYEASTQGGEVFLATELIEGRNLESWLEPPRSRREILRVFRQAGRGLEAAHRAGVVHRDFKPKNVMVGEDGRVVVVDFGLARAADGEDSPQEPPAARGESVDGSDTPPALPGASLSRFAGTPAYMAPEQRRGDEVGPAADQYSFALSLWRALSGRPPAALHDPEERKASRLPASLLRILRRGGSHEPTQRYPSLTALLDELERAAGRRARITRLAAAVGAAALLAAVLLSLPDRRPPPCGSGPEKMRGTWDDNRRRQLTEAFTPARSPGGPDPTRPGARPRVLLRTLDDYAGRWLEVHRATCEATHVHGEQSSELLDLRMGCLEQRRRELAALVDVLLEAGPGERPDLGDAVEAATGLRSLGACAETATLLALVRPPLTPEQLERAENGRERLARADALRAVGRFEAGLEIAEAVAAEAREIDDWALLAEARLAAGRALAEEGEGEAAESALVDAALAAKVARHDRAAAEAFVDLVEVAEYLEDRTERAAEYGEHAAALLEQLGEPPALSSRLLTHTGILHFNAGRFDEAAANYRRALELIRGELGPVSPQAVALLRRLGTIASTHGDHQRALELFGSSLAMAEEIYGADEAGRGRLEIARILNSIATTQKIQGRYDQALEAHGRALAIARQVLGTHFRVANLLTDYGGIYLDKGEPARALELFDEARTIYDETLGEEHPIYAILLSNIGMAHHSLGDSRRALEALRPALEKKRRIYGDEHPEFAATALALADALGDAGERKEALALFGRAAASLEQAFDGAHYLRADAAQGLGTTLLELGRAREALPHLETALQMRLDIDEEPRRVAASRFALARTLVALGPGPGESGERARELASAARQGLAALGERGREDLAEVEAFLDERGWSREDGKAQGKDVDQDETSPDSKPSVKSAGTP